MHHELDALLHVDHFFGQAALAELHSGARLVNQVDGLVGQIAIRDIAAGIKDGRPQRFIGVGDGMKLFVTVFDAKKDLDSVVFAGRRDLDGLEPPLE